VIRNRTKYFKNRAELDKFLAGTEVDLDRSLAEDITRKLLKKVNQMREEYGLALVDHSETEPRPIGTIALVGDIRPNHAIQELGPSS